MDFLQLGDDYSVRNRFNNYESLLWKEVYRGVGDFEMTTGDIDAASELFNLGAAVGIDDSGEVGIVDRITRSIDNQGRTNVVITGKFATDVFNNRPALPVAASTSFLDAEMPDGWDFGDKLGGEILDPRAIMDAVIRTIDFHTYGRTELRKLALPFSYRDWTEPTNPTDTAFRHTPQRYYSFDRSETVMDVLNTLMDHGNFSLMTIRPGFDKWDYVNGLDLDYDPTRPIILAKYRPVLKSHGAVALDRAIEHRGVMFSHETQDYLAVSKEDSRASATTFGIDLAEDYVRTNDLDGDDMEDGGIYTGLRAKVRLTEGNYAGLPTEGEEIKQVLEKMAYQPWVQYIDDNILDLELDGQYPFHDKKYEYNPHRADCFYLGDMVAFQTPWSNPDASYLTQVVEFTRVMDQEGYREFPRFTQLGITTRPQVSEEGGWTMPSGDLRQQGYANLVRSIKQHNSWT